MALPKQADPQFRLRLPEHLHTKLKNAAPTNSRSINAEIVARLEASFSVPSHDHDAIKQALREVLEERDGTGHSALSVQR